MDKQKPRKLLALAVAMSMLVFDKAREEYVKEKKYGSDKVDAIRVLIYANKAKSSDIDLQMRLFYNKCGGSIEFDFPEEDNIVSPTANGSDYYLYRKEIDVSRNNIDAKRFNLELERCRIKDFQFFYKISYKTADNVWHPYADTYSLKKNTIFSGETNCITLPRRQSAIIRKVRFSSGQSSPVDSEDCKISIMIMGKDAWLPSYIKIDLLDEGGRTIYNFSKSWPDHLWLTYKSKSKNLPEYDLIQNCVDVFCPPTR